MTAPAKRGLIYLEIGQGIDSPPIRETGVRAIWKLVHRYNRLCDRADRERGTCINLRWYEVSDAIGKTLDYLEGLGVDTEDQGFWRRWMTPEQLETERSEPNWSEK